MNTHKVKCILVNSKDRKVEYVYCDITDSRPPTEFETSHSHPFWYNDLKVDHYFHYNSASPSMISSSRPKDKGYIWSTAHYQEEPKELGELDTEFIEGFGDGLIVAYRESKQGRRREHPIDIELPLEWVERRISEYTDGYNRQVPEFTCMFSPKFDEPDEYELLLRVENKERLGWHYDIRFDRPIKQLTSQILTFSLEYNEITIIIGKVQSQDQLTRVMIIRNDQADLSQVASITIAAHKAPSWIKNRLESFFRQIFFENKLKKEETHLSLV